MKGEVPWILWAALILVLSMPLAYIGAQHLALARETDLKNDARFLTFEMASIINILQSAPDGTEHVFELPGEKCKIEILPSENKVKITFCPAGVKEIYGEMEILETNVEIEPRAKDPAGALCDEPVGNAIVCGGKIVFKKDKNKITVSDA